MVEVRSTKPTRIEEMSERYATCSLAGLRLIILLLLVGPISAQDRELGTVDIADALVLEWSPAGTYILTGHHGGIVLWHGSTGALVQRLPLQSSRFPDLVPSIYSAAWDPDETRVAVRLTFPEGSIIQIIDITNSNIVIDNIDGGAILGLDWSPDGTRLASPFTRFSKDALEIRILDAVTGQLLQTIPISFLGNVKHVRWSSDGTYLAAIISANNAPGLILWDGNTGAELRVIPHENVIRDFDWSPDNDRIVTNDSEDLLQFWAMATGERVNAYTPFSSTGDVDWNPSNDMLALKPRGSDVYHGIIVIDANTSSTLYEISERTQLLSWKPDGSELATILGHTPLLITDNGEVMPQPPVALAVGLIESVSSTFITLINDGQTIDLQQFGAQAIDIQAYPNLASTGSIVFDLNGQETVDNEAPFTVVLPSSGEFTLTVTPFTEKDAQGSAGSLLAIEFTVQSSGHM